MVKMRLRMRGGLLDYTKVEGAETPKSEITHKNLSLLSRIGL